jgi:hypothetical protein
MTKTYCRFVAGMILSFTLSTFATMAHGQIFVSMPGSSTILQFSTSGGPPTTFASGLPSGLANPQGLAFDSAGLLYTVNGGNNTIMKFPVIPVPGNSQTAGVLVPASGSGLFSSFGLIFRAGFFYAASGGLSTIEKFDNSGIRITPTFASTGVNADPYGLTFDTTGNLYVANRGAQNILMFPPGSSTPSVFASGLSGLRDLVWRAGVLYVAAGGNTAILEFTATGSSAGTPRPSPTFIRVGDPRGLAFDCDGNLYVSGGNGFNGTLTKFNSMGSILWTESTGLDTPGFIAIQCAPTSPISTNVTSCLPMINPSFEVDSFTILPGYIGFGGANGPITGWTSAGNVGINPVAGATAATANTFSDNGTIPDGKQVAFMQADLALSQMVGGFTVGAQYYVHYYENSRGWNNGTLPFLEVKIGGVTIVAAHAVSPVGGSNPYHHVTSSAFTATATSLELAFIKSNPQGDDTTALIDSVCIMPLICVPAPTNMVMWLTFDELSGTTSTNLVTGGNNGVQMNGPVVTSGLVANSLSFNGAGQYVAVPSYSAINFGTNDFSIDAWIMRATNDSAGTPRFLVDKRESELQTGTGFRRGFTFLLEAGGTLAFQIGDGNSDPINHSSSLAVPNDGQWHHVAVTVDRDNTNGIVFYRDGAASSLFGNPVPYAGTVSTAVPLRVGSREPGLGGTFWGSIDELELFNRVLAPTEIAALFNAGPAGKCKTPCDIPILVNCGAAMTVPCGTDWKFAPPTATSCCSTNVTIRSTGIVTNGVCPQVITQTWLIADDCGNTATCSQTVTVVDTAPPVLTRPASKTVNCSSIWSFDPPTALDACSGTNVAITILGTVTNGFCPQLITRTWRATDTCNNSATATQTVAVLDSTPPVLTCATNKTVMCGTVWRFDLPSALDACSGTNVTVSILNTTTNGVSPMVITQTWQATDACGNSATCSQTVTVQSGDSLTNGDFSLSVPANGTGNGWTSSGVATAGGGGWGTGANGNPGGGFRLNETGTLGRNPTVQQTLCCLIPGNCYTLHWQMKVHVSLNNPNSLPSFGVLLDGNSIAQLNIAPGDTAWRDFSVDFTATNSCQTISFSAEIDPTDVSYDLDNVRLEPCRAKPCVPAPGNMVLWLTLDEASGPTSTNLIPIGNNGTHVNSPVVTTGLVANSLTFNGVNQYVEVPSYAAINFGTNDFSIDAWVKRATNDTGSSVRNIVDKRDESGGVRGYAFYLSGSLGTLGFQLGDGPFSNYGSTLAVPNDGQWHHVAVTVDRDNTNGVLFYLNGSADSVPRNPVARSGSVSTTAPLRVGSRSSMVDFLFSGSIDEVELFSRVLAQEEIATIFNAGSAGKCKPYCDIPLLVQCAINKTVDCGTVWKFDLPIATGKDVTITSSGTVTNGVCPQVVTQNWLIADACGNTAKCSQSVTVVDTTAPVISGVPTGSNLGCNPANLPTDASISLLVNATDKCGVAILNVSHVDLSTGCSIRRTFTITASDACLNTSAASTVTYSWTADTTGPVISGVPSGGNLGCNPANLPTTASVRSLVSATDNCGIPVINVSQVDSGTACAMKRTFTITASDACLNPSAPHTVVYTWSADVVPPFVKCHPSGSLTVALDSNCLIRIPLFRPPTTDNCTPHSQLVYTQDPPAGTLLPGPSQLLTVTVTDACGNSSKCPITVHGKDKTPPKVDWPHSLTVTNCLVPNVLPLKASDNCTPLSQLIFTQSPAALTPIAAGVNSVTVTAKDIAGNITTRIISLITSGPQSFLGSMFNTGVANNKIVLSSGAIDPHYTLGLVPANTPTGPNLYNAPNAIVSPLWPLPPFNLSEWIAPASNSFPFPSGSYTYTNKFTLPAGGNHLTASISGRWAANDSGKMYFNGIQVSASASPYQWTSFTINSGFLPFPAVNTILLVVTNQNPHTGVRVEVKNAVINCGACAPPSVVWMTPDLVRPPYGTAAFTVNAGGTPPFTYQWYRNGVLLSDNGHYAGVTSPTLTIASPLNADAGAYTVVFSNSCGGFAWSSKLKLTPGWPGPWGWWNFADIGNPLAATVGPPLMMTGVNNLGVSSGTTEDFYLPPLAGQIANVMHVPGDALIELPFIAPLGSNSISSYTLIMDVYAPSNSIRSASTLFDSGGSGMDGLRLLMEPTEPMGIGNRITVTGIVGGVPLRLVSDTLMTPGGWNRVALVVNTPNNSGLFIVSDPDTDLSKYLNGQRVAHTTVATAPGLALDWTNPPTLFSSLAETGGESYVASVQFHPGVAMTPEMIAVIGSPNDGPIPPDDTDTADVGIPDEAPAIIQQPQSQENVVGANVTLSVMATGTSPLSYLWRFNNNPMAGATNVTYRIFNAQTNNAGIYDVVVSNASGSVTSAPARLTMKNKFTIGPNPDGTLTLSWPPDEIWILQQSPSLFGPWSNSPSQSNPVNLRPSGLNQYYRLVKP